jgi:hypothetical protein
MDMNNPIVDPDTFETHDIYLAAYFMTASCSLEGRRKQGARWYFIFKNPAGSMKELREAFYTDKGLVPASKYADAIKKVKELCFCDL